MIRFKFLQGLSGSCVDHRLEGLQTVAGKPIHQVLMPGLQCRDQDRSGCALEVKLTCLANGHSTESWHGKIQGP